MIQLVFLLEEPSAKILLESLLPRVLPPEVSFICIPHEGKQDLDKSIPVKLKHWNVPNSWFVVVRDKDQSDCVQLKQRLQQLCEESGRPETLIRIAVHELESWFLGDLAAVGTAFNLPRLSGKQHSKKFRDPDVLANAQESAPCLYAYCRTLVQQVMIAPQREMSYIKKALEGWFSVLK